MARGRHIPYEENHKINDAGALDKKCGKHHIHFPDENPWFPCTDEYYYKEKSNSIDGLNTYCKKCTKQNTLIWQENNRQVYLDYCKKGNNKPGRMEVIKEAKVAYRKDGKQKIWQRKNPEKLKQYALNHRQHDITEAEWRGCLKVFDNACAYCGLPVTQHIVQRNGKCIIMNLHKDHADHEGYNDLRNAIPACRSCNDRKWSFPMEEWYKEQEFFNEERLKFIKWWIGDGYKEYIDNKPPYRVIRKKNINNNKFHWELWSVDEMRNFVTLLTIGAKKKDLDLYILNNILELI